MATLFKIRGISSSKYETNEYVKLFLYLLGQTPNRELAYACINKELHFVGGFAANILIETDIIGPKSIIINLREKTVYVSSCAITLDINAKQQGSLICRKLLRQCNIIVSTHSQALISFTS